ncbi:Pre-mRNA-processing ATP-dependent RNA helicase [Venturia nashicola]|uniref:Pre-mRNA-processing ATP-dependent RNA helicase n=1 Tax=Venturia nashicola TaxID=86259 RepID=A0A4Z1P338_9PEZI|nr:Pre-mRNA-processing ATP-dependent RNA helicase [Venturia nashicola]TLD34887.1 Pre-mRNA-processing ATP-dependent RNA helicase [Venturia nashicola]
MSARATSPPSTTETPVGGTIVPDTSPSPTTTKPSGGSTDKGGAIFQVPTTTNTLPSPTPIITKPTSISTSIAAPTAADEQQTTSNNLGLIIGSAVGGLLILILALLAFCCWKRRKSKQELNLHTMPYSVAVPFSVSRKPRLDTMLTSTVDVPVFIHEKRITADTMVERNDSKRVGDEEQGPVELPTHHSRTFLSETDSESGVVHNRTPSELPGPINLPPPPSTYAELPSQDLRPPQAETQRSVNVSPVDPTASVRTSMVSSLGGSAASPNPNNTTNTPHVMAWANFNGDVSSKVQRDAYPGKRAYSPMRVGEGGGMQERVTGPNMEPVWPGPPREMAMPKVREGPEDIES